MVWLILMLPAVSLGISLLLLPWLIGWGRRSGRVDRPGSESHKLNDRIVPTTGGIAVFAAIAGPMLAMVLAVWLIPTSAWSGFFEPLGEHIAGLRRMTPLGVGILAGLAVLHVVGLADDHRSLGPWSKLAAQLGVAAALVLLFDLRVLQLLDAYGLPGTAASVSITVLWIVAITNAFNMLDNMDGLSAGVAGVITTLYLASTLIGGQWFVAGLCALLLGALVGFLVHNFPPARVYLGDAGSLVVGLLLAVISIRTTYFDEQALRPAQWYGILMPLMIMAIPLYDFVSVTFIRLLEGKSPFVGDQNHFSHRLVRKGLSKRAAVIVIWLATAATGLSGVMLATLQGWQAALAAAQTAAVLCMLALMERSGAGQS